MNKGFLYTKPIVPGIIDDTPMDLDSWFLDDSREVLKEKLMTANLEQVILELVQIFRDGEPNYQVLIGMFDSELEKQVTGSTMVYQLFSIRRSAKGINTIELFVDSENLAISSFNIYTEEKLQIKSLSENLIAQGIVREDNNCFEIQIGDRFIKVIRTT